ncbi:UDP-glucuronosyltransferase 1A1-like [Haliotis rubra]|uniref:UDP-glucuronosyltransferase 1A1-like n=1 Tax=Haliotis rubra TaxID=36100 RepID=UPI001EE560D4|nr:UDP-glucuronosyltransferase 1A1-like [Haliotis rubra]XP_046564067.1 UDP-glucuronosyltransferase 1A1-like [Haliotis rubra]XP_046564068.1 UDP-glucuronosyltransferase 1A1-like [Haliotis rubra]XP_046564069.1 UDP-glucuronosyltransferase 1A1-like [Haliotis rubra]
MSLSTFLLLTTFVSCCHGAKILLMPTPTTSHCLEIMSIGQALLKRGHDVTLFAVLSDPKSCIGRFDTEAFKEQFTLIVPDLDPSMQKAHDDIMATAGKIIFNRDYKWKMFLNIMKPMIHNHCSAAMKDRVVLERLKKDKYDIALVARMPGSECLFAIAAYLGVPTVAVYSYLDPRDTGMPLQSNTIPHITSSFTNDMTFPERFLNTLSSFVTPLVFKVFIQSIDYSVLDKKLEGVDGSDLVKRSLLFIENSDYIIDYPKAVFPNFVQCGGLTASPANPLSAEMKRYMDAATDGVVLVTFGSLIKGFPSSLIEKLMSAFGRLKYQVLFKQDKEEIRGNIKSMKWIQQNDILGHPNTKVFISHCGKNGFWEAVYHGVPIICMPIHAETFTTAIKVKKYNIGSRIEIFDDSVDDLFEKIRQVLESTVIRQNMKRMSSLLRDRPEKPADRAASAVEHVLKYGGDHMRPPSVSFVSYIYADVWVTIAVIVGVITTAVVWICRKCCCKGQTDRKRKTE